ncbi:toxic anion resistance protein [Rossellomorea marisflavi]|uniref:toxic anion resistance protein n=1 Tax=Rossellomorea marisflavi TaxID=189381 RepID=UPI003F9EEB62
MGNETTFKTKTREDLASMLDAGTAKQELVAVDNKNEGTFSIESVPEEKREEVMQLANMIDITQTDVVMQYGTKSQRELSSFSDTVLSEIKMKDSGEAGELLSDLMGKVRKMDVTTLEQKDPFLAKLPIIGRFFEKAEQRLMQFEDMQTYLGKVTQNLDVAKYGILKDITKLDAMYEKNLNYFEDLNLYISAGEAKLQLFEEEVLVPLREEATQSNDPAVSQKLTDMIHSKERFEKRVHDLKLSRTISLQMAPQIRVIQQNNQILAERIESSVVNTIPLWKNQVVLALSLSRQENALKMQQDVRNTTNALLEQNSAMLKDSSVKIAKENEKGIVSIESLKVAQQNLIATLDETLKIQSEGKQKRDEAELELINMEDELKKKVLQIANAERK